MDAKSIVRLLYKFLTATGNHQNFLGFVHEQGVNFIQLETALEEIIEDDY